MCFVVIHYIEVSTLNYRMTVERYPNPNKGVGNSIPGYEIFSLLDGKSKRPPTIR